MIKNKKFTKLICFDFDGVIHSYESGWQGVDKAIDEPVPGAKGIIESLINTDGVSVCIFSTRNRSLRGRKTVRKYLTERVGLSPRMVKSIKMPLFKPIALVYIDDRGIMFQGKFPSVSEILNFKPWNYNGNNGQ